MSYQDLYRYYSSDNQRQAQGTDYAKSKGLWLSTDDNYLNNCYWWTRSACTTYSHIVYNFYQDGNINSFSDANNSTFNGIRAA